MIVSKDPELMENVRVLALQGMTVRAIAHQLGVPEVRVRYQIGRLLESRAIPYFAGRKREAGLHTPMRVADLARRTAGIRLGKVGDVLDGLTTEQAEWLMTQIPKGAAMTDILRAFVVDAFYDDTGASHGSDKANPHL